MSWPYRWLFRAKTSKCYYALKKKLYMSTTPPREVDIMDPIVMLTGGASSSDSSVPNQMSNCLTEMVNPGIGNPAFQNGCAPYPPGNPTLGPGFSVAPRPTSPATYDAGTPHPSPNAPNVLGPPVYSSFLTGQTAYPTQPLGPVYPPYSGVPQPDASPPSYDFSYDRIHS